jgi:hypothetical protein
LDLNKNPLQPVGIDLLPAGRELSMQWESGIEGVREGI